MFLHNVLCYIIFPSVIQQKSLCCISSRLHLAQHPWLCREFPLSLRILAAVQGSTELDVATGAVCGMAADGRGLGEFAGPFLNLLVMLASSASCDSDFHSFIVPHGEKGLCSLV